MSLQWREEFSVHNEILDNQHKKLFELLNTIEKATYSTDFESIIPNILDELNEYVAIHFTTEEDYMKNKNFDGLPNHHEIHETLKLKVYEEIEFNKTKGYTTLKVMHLYNFLKDWIENHIIIEDHKY